jgi:hypothetical protein
MNGDLPSQAEMAPPLFIATERFDAADGEKWDRYCEWAKIPSLTELVSLDSMMCPHVITDFTDEDWNHIVCEDFRLSYFHHLDYLKLRVQGRSRINILGVYRNPETHITTPPASASFSFVGYDLIEEMTQISALNNCGGFPDVFRNDELNQFGLLEDFARATEVRRHLRERYPNESHAGCELYALWRLNDSAR